MYRRQLQFDIFSKRSVDFFSSEGVCSRILWPVCLCC